MTLEIETLDFYIGIVSGVYNRIIWQNSKPHHQFFARSFYDDEPEFLMVGGNCLL